MPVLDPDAPPDPTPVADLAPPAPTFGSVKLLDLKTTDNDDVWVRCDALAAVDLVGAASRFAQAGVDVIAGGAIDLAVGPVLAAFDDLTPTLIEKSTALLAAGGALQRPAFWFSAPIAGALAGSILSARDRSRLAFAILQLSQLIPMEAALP